MKKVHVIVSGQVQGVGFRTWAAEEADALQVTGWVRNLRDATVEAVFCGEDATVDKMLRRVESGPLGARVEQVLATDWKGASFSDFTVLPTCSA